MTLHAGGLHKLSIYFRYNSVAVNIIALNILHCIKYEISFHRISLHVHFLKKNISDSS